MSTPSSPSRELYTAELRSLIARDLTASNELAARITQLRQDIADGKPLPPKKIGLMESSNKDMTKDLVARVERVENSDNVDATDREMLQALNARLAVCDMQAMRLAELRDLELVARGEKRRAFLKGEAKDDAVAAEPVGELTVGRASTPQADEGAAARESSYEHGHESRDEEYDADNDDAKSEYEEEPEIDQSNWPLLHRILGVNPETDIFDMPAAINGAYKKLALMHDPKRFPNDSDAPTRWTAITAAYDVLSDSDKRMYYDQHEKTPALLVGFDLATLDVKKH